MATEWDDDDESAYQIQQTEGQRDGALEEMTGRPITMARGEKLVDEYKADIKGYEALEKPLEKHLAMMRRKYGTDDIYDDETMKQYQEHMVEQLRTAKRHEADAVKLREKRKKRGRFV
jgi:hypothetical protein